MKDEIPNLVLDFELKDESIYIKYYNASDFEAHNISVEFTETILGLGGRKKISSLKIFRELAYMAPNKEFLVYVDELDSFFSFFKNNIIIVHIEYFNNNRKKLIKKITHNLGIYRDLPIIIKNK